MNFRSCPSTASSRMRAVRSSPIDRTDRVSPQAQALRACASLAARRSLPLRALDVIGWRGACCARREMRQAFRAIALDYDGTLTTRERPADDVLSALRETRIAGITLLLVTGRVVSDLRRDFPDVGDYFDVVVAENGAVT